MTTAHFDLAQAFLDGLDLDGPALEDLIKALKADKQFAMARRVLARVATLPLAATARGGKTPYAVWVEQQRALCTYKDRELPPLNRLREALGILRGIGLFDPALTDPETLGLGGAVFKGFWEQEGNVAQLYSALGLYRAGWARNPDQDLGYCGVNAAFLLDKLAALAERTARGVAGDMGHASALRAEANALRREILSFLADRPAPADESAPNVWAILTRAELHFGLRDYASATVDLADVRKASPADWKAETSARQLIDLARSQNILPSPAAAPDTPAAGAWAALAALLGEDAEAAAGLVRGRVGLALSGGGFRASFYHLGVLARLAEVDALRHVEVISAVSGGSIVGVHYYLELKHRLEQQSDLTLTRDDYLDVVRTVQNQFFAAVGKNLRMSTLANLGANLKMLWPGYSRSMRIGELYEDLIYRQAGAGTTRRRVMSDLLIRPAGHDATRQFKPNDENWRRRAKVPILLINSTSLNSGHNYQFTAEWMGEPPGLIGDEVDMNARYARVRYAEAPTDETRAYPLGYAVAASAGVPVLFEPLRIAGLYPDCTLKLVDGGVHDNQGVAGLLDQGCTFILCSDASGQMHDLSAPGSGLLGVALRSDEIAQDRVREAQYADLAARERNGGLRGLMFVHLKAGLAPKTITPDGQTQTTAAAPSNQTPYGIDRDIQRLLSEIRTDLDGFSEVEAHSLMLSGYLATAEELRHEDERHARKGAQGHWGDFDLDAPRGDWPFRRLEAIAALPAGGNNPRREDLGKQLEVGSQRMFKAFRLIPWLCVVGVSVGAAVALGLLYAGCVNRDQLLPGVTWGFLTVTLAVLALAAYVPLARVLDPKSAARSLFFKLGIAVAGWVFAKLHLWFIDPRFQRRGRIDRLLNLPAGGPK